MSGILSGRDEPEGGEWDDKTNISPAVNAEASPIYIDFRDFMIITANTPNTVYFLTVICGTRPGSEN